MSQWQRPEREITFLVTRILKKPSKVDQWDKFSAWVKEFDVIIEMLFCEKVDVWTAVNEGLVVVIDDEDDDVTAGISPFTVRTVVVGTIGKSLTASS